MKYIIMCGGKKQGLNSAPALMKVNGERLIDRTIRLLKEFGITDISISCALDNKNFDDIGVKVLKKENNYSLAKENGHTVKSKSKGYWVEAFYFFDEPCCYLCGDVWYSKAALKTIIETDAKDFRMFGTRQPLPKFCTKWEEPMAFIIKDRKLVEKYCELFKEYEDYGLFNRKGMSWELYRLIEGFDPNKHITGDRFTAIHDFAVDIDNDKDAEKLGEVLKTHNVD